MVIVECKVPGHELDGALRQARSHCEWVKPVSYVVTSG